MIAYLFQSYPENLAFQLFRFCSNLSIKFAIFKKLALVSIAFSVDKQNFTAP